jgi:hypothetical protein
MCSPLTTAGRSQNSSASTECSPPGAAAGYRQKPARSPNYKPGPQTSTASTGHKYGPQARTRKHRGPGFFPGPPFHWAVITAPGTASPRQANPLLWRRMQTGHGCRPQRATEVSSFSLPGSISADGPRLVPAPSSRSSGMQLFDSCHFCDSQFSWFRTSRISSPRSVSE